MLKRAVASRYAKALFALAKEKDIVQNIKEDYPKVTEVVDSEEDLSRFLNHPAIGEGEKKKVLASLFEGKINEHLYDMLCLLVDKDREDYISLIWDELQKLILEDLGQERATVYTPFELSEEIKKELVDRLSSALGKTVILEEAVDKDIIGGVRVQIGDRVYDGSVVSKLKQLKEAMQSAGV